MEETYDLEAVYDNEISPLMAQIIEICEAHRIPMLATFAYEQSEERGTGLCTLCMTFEGRRPSRIIDASFVIKPPDDAEMLASLIMEEGQSSGNN